MSQSRRFPGQSILERLGGRGIVRPQLGASPTFYERFGLADPWMTESRWEDVSEESPFYFLSAAPYYARLRALRREDRARRQLMERLNAEPLAVKAFGRRMSSGIAAVLGQRGVGGSRPFGMPSVNVDSVHWIDPGATAALYFEEQAELEESEPEWSARRSRPQKARKSQDAYLARKQLAQLAPLMRSTQQRAMLKRAIEEVQLLPVTEQVSAARRIVRQVAGPARRIAGAVMSSTLDKVETGAVSVARSRATPTRSKGLRRMLGTTPSMAVLAPEMDVEDAPIAAASTAAPRTRNVERVRPSRRPVETGVARREARQQNQAGRAGPTDVPVLGAGTPSVVARQASSSPVRPTARAMERAVAAPTTPLMDVRRGLEASRPAVPTAALAACREAPVAPSVRAAARSLAGVRVTASGQPLVSPSATSYMPESRRESAPRIRRNRAVRAAPSTWLIPGSVEVDEPSALDTGVVAPTRRRDRAGGRSPATSWARDVSSRDVVATRSALGPGRPVRETRSVAAIAVTPSAARAVLRAEPVLRRDVAGRAMLAPAPTAHVTNRMEEGLAPSSMRRSATRPVFGTASVISGASLLAGPDEVVEDEAPGAATEALPVRRRRSRAMSTAPGSADAVESQVVTRGLLRQQAEASPMGARLVAAPLTAAAVRGEGRVELRPGIARTPVSHIEARAVEEALRPEPGGVAAPSVARQSVRRSRLLAPSAQALAPASMVDEDTSMVEAVAPTGGPQRTARVARGRSVAGTPGVASRAPVGRTAEGAAVLATTRVSRSVVEVSEAQSPSVRALARAVPGRALDSRGDERVLASPTRYVEASDPVAPHVAARASRAEALRERRSSLFAPSAVLASTAVEGMDEVVGDSPAPIQGSRRAARALPASSSPRAVTAGAAAHAVRRAVHASRDRAVVPAPATRFTSSRELGAASVGLAAMALPDLVGRATRGNTRRSLLPRPVAPKTLDFQIADDATELDAIVSPGAAPKASRRATSAAPSPTENVVERLASALRAALRGDDPTVVVDASRRTLRLRVESGAPQSPVERADARLGAAEPTRMLRPASFGPMAPGQVVLDPAEAFAAAAEQDGGAAGFGPAAQPGPRSATPRTGSGATPATRRVASPSPRILGRHHGSSHPAARWTDRRVDGTIVAAPSARRAQVRRSVMARAEAAASAGGSRQLFRHGPGFGAPAMMALTAPVGDLEEGATHEVTSRPLARTLGQLDPDTAPLPGSAASPGWAQRATHGTAATTREQIRATRAMRKDSGLFTALARTSSAEEVVRVILERGDSIAGMREELGAPAAAMVERIVRMRNSIVDTDGVLQPAHLAQTGTPDPLEAGNVPHSPADGGSLPRVSRSARSVRAMPSSFLTPSRSSEGLGSSNVMKLAGKLQRLIHLAEDERRLREAQAQVRMSEEKPGEGALAHGPNATPNDETPDIGSLQRDVLHAVMHEIEWHKKRRQEDPDGPDRW